MKQLVLEMRDVAKSYPTPRGPVHALGDVNIGICRGEFVMITGPSGSGKTTFIQIAGLLDCPTSGKVVFEGRDAVDMDERTSARVRAERIGMVFQRFHLLGHLSALENVAFRFRYTDVPRDDALARSRRMLQAMGIETLSSTRAASLSAGEMQRVAIARAVVLEPAVLFADEPTGNLDSKSADSVMDIMGELHRKGLTIVMATHNERLLRHATRHIACTGGRMQEVA